MSYIKHGYPKLVVDLGKLRHNIEYVKKLCADVDVEIAGVIKGCTGLVPCAREYEKAGVKFIASSRLEQLAALSPEQRQAVELVLSSMNSSKKSTKKNSTL